EHRLRAGERHEPPRRDERRLARRVRPDRVHAAEEVAVAAAEVAHRDDPEADLVRDRDAQRLASGDDRGRLLRLPLDALLVAAALEDVREPEREAVEDEAGPGGDAGERAPEVDRLLDRRPAGRAGGAVAGDALRHLLVARL